VKNDGKEFLCGDHLTSSDFMVLFTFDDSVIAYLPPLGPKTKAYVERMKARPAFKSVSDFKIASSFTTDVSYRRLRRARNSEHVCVIPSGSTKEVPIRVCRANGIFILSQACDWHPGSCSSVEYSVLLLTVSRSELEPSSLGCVCLGRWPRIDLSLRPTLWVLTILPLTRLRVDIKISISVVIPLDEESQKAPAQARVETYDFLGVTFNNHEGPDSVPREFLFKQSLFKCAFAAQRTLWPLLLRLETCSVVVCAPGVLDVVVAAYTTFSSAGSGDVFVQRGHEGGLCDFSQKHISLCCYGGKLGLKLDKAGELIQKRISLGRNCGELCLKYYDLAEQILGSRCDVGSRSVARGERLSMLKE